MHTANLVTQIPHYFLLIKPTTIPTQQTELTLKKVKNDVLLSLYRATDIRVISYP